MAGTDAIGDTGPTGWSGNIRLGPSVVTYRCEPIEGHALDPGDVARLRSDILSEVRDLLRDGHLRGTVAPLVCVGLLPGSQDDDNRPVACEWSIAEAA